MRFSLAIITLLGILILSMNICTNYNSAYAQEGNSQSLTSSPWTTGAPIPTPRSEIAGTALNGKVYIIGGFDETGRSTTTVEVYDPIADKWTSAAT